MIWHGKAIRDINIMCTAPPSQEIHALQDKKNQSVHPTIN